MSEFVTNDVPEESSTSIEESPIEHANAKGVAVAGWVLAILLPFVGVFLNLWVVKNAKTYGLRKGVAIAALLVSIALSLALLIFLFSALYSFYFFNPTVV